MNPVVGIDPDQVGGERRVVNRRQRNAVGLHGLAPAFVRVGNDVGRVQQHGFGQAGQHAASAIGRQHGLAKGGLVVPLPDLAQGIAPFRRAFRGRFSKSDRTKSDPTI